MSNRMQAFRLDPASPNVLAGGKRPRTTLTPTVVLKDGKPFLAIGTPGGDSQDQQILLVLLNIIDFGSTCRRRSRRRGSTRCIRRARSTIIARSPACSKSNGRLRPTFSRSCGPAVTCCGCARRTASRPGVVAAGIDPVTGRLRGGADPRRERALVA